MAEEPLLSQRQAAAYLNVSIVTLQRWRKRNPPVGPPSIVLPNGYRRYRKSDLDAWLREHQAEE
jgi:DNA-binding transcriptional MerR regulator